MKKLAEVYRDSARELDNFKSIVVAGMFLAVSVVLGFFTIEAGPYLKIGFGSVVNQFVYFLFGPVLGCVYGGVLDLVKYVARPTGGYFPGFTFNAMLAGVIYGTFLYKRPLSFKRVLAVNFVVIMICNVFFNTLWLSMMSGKGMVALLPLRLVKNMIMWPVDSAIFYVLANMMERGGITKAIRQFRLVRSQVKN